MGACHFGGSGGMPTMLGIDLDQDHLGLNVQQNEHGRLHAKILYMF